PARRRRPRRAGTRPPRTPGSRAAAAARGRVPATGACSLVPPDQDADEAGLRLVGLVTEAAVLELRIEEQRPTVVAHLQLRAGGEPLRLLEDAQHGLGGLEAADVEHPA